MTIHTHVLVPVKNYYRMKYRTTLISTKLKLKQEANTKTKLSKMKNI